MKNKLILILASVFVITASFMSIDIYKDDHKFTVVIDPGHGGKDPGAMSNGAKEKDIVLSVGLKLGKMIQDSFKDVNVVYTRKTDVFIELSQRSQIANKAKGDLFISIHANANDNPAAEGTETFVMGTHKNDGWLEVAKRENASILLEADYENNESYGGFDPNSPIGHIIFSLYQNAFITKSLSVAEKVENELKTNKELKSRGVKQAGFLVLWKTSMPSILVELGFITNPKNREFMTSQEGQDKLTHNLYNAFKWYYLSNES